MLNFKRTIIFGMLLVMAVSLNAQQERVIAAFSFFQKNNLDSAIILIDQAVADSESVNDGEAWYLRGFIYKSKYNASEKSNKKSPSRIIALNSFKRSLLIDTAKVNVEKNKSGIKYLATTIYNDAVEDLDSVNYKRSIENYETFKEYYKIVDTSKANLKQNEIKFLLALAHDYNQVYEGNRKGRPEFLNLTKSTYSKVLALDPNNVSANYSMGVLFYNEAVNLITQNDYDIDIVALNDIQDNSLKIFKESLPFMEKAYELDPKRKDTLLGLSGIYFSLNEFEKSNLFKQKYQQLGK